MLEIKNLNVRLDDFHLRDINLKVEHGDYFVLLGPSGSGKSVLLETIAGLIKPGSGKIYLNGTDITFAKIADRKTGLMFQDNTAFPHLTVKKNIDFAIRLTHKKKEFSEQILNRICDELNIRHLLHRLPMSLSGGELQRVILARTLVSEPKILMLDEPLSSLDTVIKDEMKILLRDLNRKGVTIIHVTHEFEEAFSLASRIGVLVDGELVASGDAEQVFRSPSNEFIARFCGHKNYFKVTFTEPGKVRVNEFVSFEVPTVPVIVKTGAVIIEPSDIILSASHFDSSARNSFEGTIKDIVKVKSGFEVIIDIGVRIISLISAGSLGEMNLVPGNRVWCTFKASSVQTIN